MTETEVLVYCRGLKRPLRIIAKDFLEAQAIQNLLTDRTKSEENSEYDIGECVTDDGDDHPYWVYLDIEQALWVIDRRKVIAVAVGRE